MATEAYCVKCKAKRDMKDPKVELIKNQKKYYGNRSILRKMQGKKRYERS